MVWGMVFKGGKWVAKIASKKLKSKVTPKYKSTTKNNNPKGTNQWSKVTKSGKPPKRQTNFRGGPKDYKRIKAESAGKRKVAKKNPQQQEYYDRVQKDPYVSMYAKKKRKPKKKK